MQTGWKGFMSNGANWLRILVAFALILAFVSIAPPPTKTGAQINLDSFHVSEPTLRYLYYRTLDDVCIDELDRSLEKLDSLVDVSDSFSTKP